MVAQFSESPQTHGSVHQTQQGQNIPLVDTLREIAAKSELDLAPEEVEEYVMGEWGFRRGTAG
jgi:hypothetical protein